MSKRFRRRPLAALFAVALLVIGVLGVYRMGWREGYGLGWMQAQPQEEAPAPSTPWGPRMYNRGWPMHGIRRPVAGGHLGRLLAFGVGLLFFGTLVKFLMFGAWHMRRHWKKGAPPHGPWGPHGPWNHKAWKHGPHPWGWGCAPWDDDEDKSDEAETDEQVAKVQPEPDAA